MSVVKKLLFRLSAFCRCRIISGANGEAYLERYHLFRLPFGYQFYLHRFIASDPGKGLHNHPWQSALSIVLSGSYDEKRLDDARNDHQFRNRQISAGQLNYINGSIFHRIDISEECWSLFIHSRKSEDLGFINQQIGKIAYIDHEAALQNKSQTDWWRTADRPIVRPSMRMPLKAA